MTTDEELTGSNMRLIRQEGRVLRRIVAVAVLAIVMFIAGGDAVLADDHQFLLCSGPGETVRADGSAVVFGDYIIVVNSRNFNAITDADDQVPEDTITEDDVQSSGGSFVRPDLSWGMWIPSGYVYEEQGTGTCVINLKIMMREKDSNYFKEAAVEFDPLPPCQGRVWLNTARPTGVAATVCPRGAPTTISGVTPTEEEDSNSGETTQTNDPPGVTEDTGETVTDPENGKPDNTNTQPPPGGNGGNGGNGNGGNGGNGNNGNGGNGNNGNNGNNNGVTGNDNGNTDNNGETGAANDGDSGAGNNGDSGAGNDGSTGGGTPGDTDDGDNGGSGSQTPTDSSQADDDSGDQSQVDLLEADGDDSDSDDLMQTEAEAEGESGAGDKQDSEKDDDQPGSTVRPDVPRTGTGGVAVNRDSGRWALPIAVAGGLAVLMTVLVLIVNRRFGNRAL